ncbi:MAG: vitamin K epoxide reductase family protein [Marinifilaceae bacterium]|jgi:uncharacterized membrane protein/glutaredoxin|nr:vitamin K epoxide reductase family protein [Marinifilaceae bacterium]
MNNNLIKILHKFLKSNHIYCNNSTIDEIINTEPELSNIIGIHRSIYKLGLKNIVIPFNSIDFDNFSDNNFILITKDSFYFCRDKYSLYNGEDKIITNNKDIYELNPIAIIIGNGKSKSYKKEKTEKINTIAYLILASIVIGLLCIYISLNKIDFLSLGSNIVGLSICFIILKNEQKQTDSFCRKLNDLNKIFNCSSSKKYYLPIIGISFSSLALAFFITNIIAFFINNFHLKFFISILTIPIILYSLYLQIFKIKKICPYCLFIIVILIFEIIHLGISDNFKIHIDLKFFLYYCFYFLISTSIAYLYQTYKSTYKKYLRLNLLNNSFRYDYEIFTLLNQDNNKKVEFFESKITFGDTELQEICIITNPNCHYCKIAFNKLKEILETERYYIKIVFCSLNTKDEYKIKKIISWYLNNSNISYSIFLDTINSIDHLNIDLNSNSEKEFEMHKNICEINNIHNVPTIFLNNKKLDKRYEINDLLFF